MEDDMTRTVRIPAAQRGLSILLLSIGIGFGAAQHTAAAEPFCVWEEKAKSGELASDDDQNIRALIQGFFAKTYDTPSMTDETIRSNIEELFASQFSFDVCNEANKMHLFRAENNFDTLYTKIKDNYHSLWNNNIVPTHKVTETELTLVDKDTVQERSSLFLRLQPPQDAQPFDYHGELRSTITKDKGGNWRFQDRLIILDDPLIVSYAR
jgi:hypothetical protein